MSLGDGAQKVGGGLTLLKAKEGGIHGNPASRSHPCEQAPTGTATLTASVETFLPDPLLTQTKTCQEGGWSGSEIPQCFAIQAPPISATFCS